MALELNSIEVRILGCLIEKQLTTPDYYPLTLNSLLAACNQKSNRDPVMNLTESEVLGGVNSLTEKYLVREKMLPGSRTAKYEHKLSDTLTKEYDFSIQQLAILSILFVRGPQTVGEIKGRTQRMAEFHDLAQVESCLDELQQHEKGPFVKVLPRQPGRREARYAHLFSGDKEESVHLQALPEHTNQEQTEIQKLRAELNDLREEFEAFKAQVQANVKTV